MNKQSKVLLKIPEAALLCLVFLLFMKIAYSQSTGNSSMRNPLAPIVLTVTPTNNMGFSYSIAMLDWNPVDPILAGDFYIERLETPLWNPIKKIRFTSGQANYSFYDTISAPFCVGSPDPFYNISYRIRFVADDATTSLSNIATSGPFADNTFPLDVINDTVSVYIDPSGTGALNGRPIIGWIPSKNNDIAGYIILRNTLPPTTYVTLDTIPADSTFFVDKDPAIDPCAQRFSYAIITLDKCGKRSPGTYNNPETQTISLSIPEISPCERKAQLSWTAYYTMPGGLGGYKVYRQDVGAFSLIYDSKGDTTKLSYSDNYNFQSDQKYTYFVRAYSKNGLYTSTSCQKQSIYKGQSMPDSLYIMQASVEFDSIVKIDYFFKPPNTVKKLHLERRDTIGGDWNVIDSIVAQPGTGSFVNQYGSFNDTSANVHSQSYTYRLVVIDDCNAPAVYSFNTAKTILLQQAFSATDNVIVWNSYNTWLKGVKEYKVYRMVDGQPPGGTVERTLQATDTIFWEPTSNFDPKSQVCYWIEANENSGNPYTTPLVIYSRSNMGCIVKDATLYMPNAFKPDNPEDHNNRLRPVYTYIDTNPMTFRMIVFDRWGKEIFETTDINGWDGRINGQIASPGLYSYLVTYRSIEGKDFIKRGTASLIR